MATPSLVPGIAAAAAGAAAGAAGAAAGAGAGGASQQDKYQEWLKAQQAAAAQQQQKPAAGGAAAGGGGSGGGSFAEKMMSGLSGGGGAAGGRGAPTNPLQQQIDKKIAFVQQMLIRNFKDPNVNTMLGCLGVAALVLRELLQANLFALRESLRGLVGSNIADFNTRLLHVGVDAGLVAWFGNFA